MFCCLICSGLDVTVPGRNASVYAQSSGLNNNKSKPSALCVSLCAVFHLFRERELSLVDSPPSFSPRYEALSHL